MATAREVPYRHMRTPEKWPSNVCMGKFRKIGWIVLFVKIVKDSKRISDHPQLSFTLPSTGVDQDSRGEVGDIFSL